MNIFLPIDGGDQLKGPLRKIESSEFDTLYSQKELGCIIEPDKTQFRLFAPRAISVRLVLFDTYNQEVGKEFSMARDSNGVWEYTFPQIIYGKYYGYRVSGPSGKGEMFNPKIVIADPYSKAVVTKNDYHHSAKTLIINTDYEWEGDSFISPENHNQLIIYEAHLRDMTAHTSSGVIAKGTYLGLTEKDRQGGLSYLKDLGINAIEFLPLQEFANIEIPSQTNDASSESGEINILNPYERNHWGYMTSYFFAPESYYATDGTMEVGKYCGIEGRAVHELKNLVKALHREGIAVIMDVVYNHVSHGDYNPLKYIDKFYYFNVDTSKEFTNVSGCGNDLRTDRPMVRRLIVESIKYWMQEYHIDGFRFDIATMIDRETCKQIAEEAKKINPHVILIAEAWGGGKYDPPGFSDIGWASWNDQFRNGIRGQDYSNALGFIFGQFKGTTKKKSIQSLITGMLRDEGGMYLEKGHSINYLESHDDLTLGDFIRLGLGDIKPTQQIDDTYANVKLSSRQLAFNKFAAMFLLVSQGPVMIAEGQEYARSKVIASTIAPDPKIGLIDHNSYEKDNETNYLNYHHQMLNKDLFDYFKGLIELRRKYSIFSNASKEATEFLKTNNDLLIAFMLKEKLMPSLTTQRTFLVILNGDPDDRSIMPLPNGIWDVIANNQSVYIMNPIQKVQGKIGIPPTSGIILMKQ